MKKIAKLLILTSCVALLFTSCAGLFGKDKNDEEENKKETVDKTPAREPVTLNVMSFTDEVTGIVKKYCELHPEEKITVTPIIVPNTGDQYTVALDKRLKENTVDIYAADVGFLLKYSKGEMADYAMPYESLGIDVNNAVTKADIAKYTIELGSNKNGKINALSYQSTGGCFIYRRSIAKEVYGTDAPAVINEKIGGGSGNWDKFWTAAGECKSKGYAIISGDGDMWPAVENSSDYGWILNNKLFIDPKREAFLDYSKNMKDNGYSNLTEDWTNAWYDDMAGNGPKKVFGFFGPAWHINYTLANNCGGKAVGEGTYGDWAVCSSPVGFYWGGTSILANKNIDASKKDAVRKIIEWITLDTSTDGLMYKWASGTLYRPNGTKDTVASGVVMSKTDGKMAFLGGQNMYDYFVPANQAATGKLATAYDSQINYLWREQVKKYANGEIEKDVAITKFKESVFTQLGIESYISN